MLADAPIFPTLPAHDIERAKAWYKDKLGLVPIRDLGTGGHLYSSGKALFVIYPTPFAGTGKHTLAGWVVADLDKEMAELRAKRSEEHTSELQSLRHLVCRRLLETQ